MLTFFSKSDRIMIVSKIYLKEKKLMRKFKFLFATLIALALIVTGMVVAVSADDSATPVASVEEFESALAEATVSKIILTADLNLSGDYDVNRDLTIDLNGKQIMGKGTAQQLFYVVNNAGEDAVTLTVTNSARTESVITTDRMITFEVVAKGTADGEPNAVVLDGKTGGIKIDITKTVKDGRVIRLYNDTAELATSATVKGKVTFANNTDSPNSGYYFISPHLAAKNTAIANISFIDADFEIVAGEAYREYSKAGSVRDAFQALSHISSATNYKIQNSTIDLFNNPFYRSTYGNAYAVTMDIDDSTITNKGVPVTATSVVNDYQRKNTFINYDVGPSVTDASTLYLRADNSTFNMGQLFTNIATGVKADIEFNNCNILENTEENGGLYNTSQNVYPQLFANCSTDRVVINGGSIRNYIRPSDSNTANPWNATAQTGILLKGAIKTNFAAFNTWSKFTVEGKLYITETPDPVTHELPELRYTLCKEAPDSNIKKTTAVDGTTDTEKALLGSFVHGSARKYGIVSVIDFEDNGVLRFEQGDVFNPAGGGAPWIDINWMGDTKPTGFGDINYDFDYLTFDMDFTHTGNGVMPFSLGFESATVAFNETKAADGTITRASTTIPSDYKANYKTPGINVYSNGTMAFSWMSPTVSYSTEAGDWTHLSVVFDKAANEGYLYLDGELKQVFVPGNHTAGSKILGDSYVGEWTDNGDGTQSRVIASVYPKRVRINASTAPELVEGSDTQVAVNKDIIIDNIVYGSRKGSSDLSDAKAAGTLLVSDDAIYQPEYAYPAGEENFATLGSLNIHSKANLLDLLSESVGTTIWNDVELYLNGDLENFKVDYSLIVFPQGNEFTYYSNNFYGYLDEDAGEYYAFFTPEDLGLEDAIKEVVWVDLAGEAVKTENFVIGSTLPAKELANLDPELKKTTQLYKEFVQYPDTFVVGEGENRIERTVSSYEADITGAKYNLSTSSYFTFNVYVPAESGVTVKDGTLVAIEGARYYMIKYGGWVSASNTNTIACPVTLTVNGVEITQTFNLSLPTYFEQILTDEDQSEEGKAVVAAAVNYCNEVTKLAGGTNAGYEALLAQHGSRIPALGEPSTEVTADDAAFADYFVGATVYYEGNYIPRFAFELADSYEGDGSEMTFYYDGYASKGRIVAVEDTRYLVSDGAPSAETITGEVKLEISLDGEKVNGYYSLANYIEATNAEFAKALYQFALATQAYVG